ncbi:unnamed protein product [Trifolium pratense]|uniref:Uncharacterized protein n=1 Tax=Trifolium pratense TaxID=57577 RepID=A0ACB0K9R7_TRIPR|nr:unnamed protein product [Trifolium pratense]
MRWNSKLPATRDENMVTKLSCLLDINEDTQQTIREAASLAMFDLATSVVTEFTALSGVMGRHYALRVGYYRLFNLPCLTLPYQFSCPL